MSRPDWDLYFIRIAKEVASRSTCPRAAVGAVIVKNNRILSTGYNGAAPGMPHCTDEGCIIKEGHCVTAEHAEISAMSDAWIRGLSLDGATLYYWDSKGRYAQSIADLASHSPLCAELATHNGIARVCGRGL